MTGRAATLLRRGPATDDDAPVDHRPRRRLDRYVAAAVATVAAMSVVAAIGFRSTLSSWVFVSSAAVGAVGASIIVLFASRRRLLLGESVALSAIAFFLLGGVAVGGVPTPSAYGAFARGLIDGWADLLSSSPPADITDQLRALPFTVAWLAAAVGGEIARSSRRPGLPAVGPILALALSLLFTIEQRRLALAQGAGVLAGTLLLIVLAQRMNRHRATASTDDFDSGAVSANRRRLMLGALVAVAAVVIAPTLGPRLPLADSHERFDLRRYQHPPFDPLQVPSPLAQVKASLKDVRKNDVVFTVSGDVPIARWPVAVLTDYDGVIWTVADPTRRDAANEFVPVDTDLPQLTAPLPDGSTTVEHTVVITDLGGNFLPLAGTARHLELPDELDPRMNLETGTIALPRGVGDGLTYTVESAVPPTVTDEQLLDATIIPVDRSKELELLPPPVRNLAADLVEGRESGWDQMKAIRDGFVDRGFYDVTDQTPPGHSYGRIATMLDDPARIVGFEEQYAAAAAVVAQVAELPVRVVVGYEIPADAWKGGTAEVTANDMSAWVELDAGPLGWVPVDVTPDRSRTPDPESAGATTQEVAIPNPPPPPPPPPNVEPPRQENKDPDESRITPIPHEFPVGRTISPWAVAAAGTAALPVVLFLLFALVVISWKALRRRRRRRRSSPTARVAGAWAEAIDRCTEAGAPRLADVTPHERVGAYVALDESLDPVSAELRHLANQLDRATYAAWSPDDELAAAAWHHSDEVSAALRSTRSARTRLRMHLDPRPLRRDHATSGARPGSTRR